MNNKLRGINKVHVTDITDPTQGGTSSVLLDDYFNLVREVDANNVSTGNYSVYFGKREYANNYNTKYTNQFNAITAKINNLISLLGITTTEADNGSITFPDTVIYLKDINDVKSALVALDKQIDIATKSANIVSADKSIIVDNSSTGQTGVEVNVDDTTIKKDANGHIYTASSAISAITEVKIDPSYSTILSATSHVITGANSGITIGFATGATTGNVLTYGANGAQWSPSKVVRGDDVTISSALVSSDVVLSTDLKLHKILSTDDPSLTGNVGAYCLINANGKQEGDILNFPADQFLEKVELKDGILIFTFKLDNGDPSQISVDLSNYIKPYSGSTSVDITNNVVSAIISKASDNRLTLATDGLYVKNYDADLEAASALIKSTSAVLQSKISTVSTKTDDIQSKYVSGVTINSKNATVANHVASMVLSASDFTYTVNTGTTHITVDNVKTALDELFAYRVVGATLNGTEIDITSASNILPLGNLATKLAICGVNANVDTAGVITVNSLPASGIAVEVKGNIPTGDTTAQKSFEDIFDSISNALTSVTVNGITGVNTNGNASLVVSASSVPNSYTFQSDTTTVISSNVNDTLQMLVNAISITGDDI